ncbi:glycosyltransferase [Planotetraspora sp. GP83]|uniref:glycosyltransferase n=1 Tax=Planotetraspora sp. GP83 TaxID=3156264 RepID=UPI003513D802
MSGTVVFVWRRIPPPFLIGGAEVSQQLLAEEFAAAGWRVIYVASHEPPWAQVSELPSMLDHLAKAGVPHSQHGGSLAYTSRGVQVRAVPRDRVEAELETVLTVDRPDLVVTSQEGSAELAAAARGRGVKVAGWLHSVSKTGMHVLGGRPHVALATSRFVLSRTPPEQAAVVFYPPFRGPGSCHHEPHAGGDLLMVNPVPAKGSGLVHRLAEALPHRRFTLVEGWWDTSADFARHPNVVWVPRTYDMAPLYRMHRLLLVPSTCEDAYPRVIVEAALAGRPTIGSTRGGIPEAVADPGMLAPPDDLDAWAALIEGLDRQALAVAGEGAWRRAVPMTRLCLPELAAAGVLP